MVSHKPSTEMEVWQGFHPAEARRGAGSISMSRGEKRGDFGALLLGTPTVSIGEESAREMEGRNTLVFHVAQDNDPVISKKSYELYLDSSCIFGAGTTPSLPETRGSRKSS